MVPFWETQEEAEEFLEDLGDDLRSKYRVTRIARPVGDLIRITNADDQAGGVIVPPSAVAKAGAFQMAPCDTAEVPSSYWATDIDGKAIIVMPTESLSDGKFLCLDEDGETMVCFGRTIDWNRPI